MITQAPMASEIGLVRSICRQSFWEFTQEFWDVVVPEEPIWNWHIPYMCNRLQKVALRVAAKKKRKYDLIFNVPPGSTKSTICSVLFPPWVWTFMPTARFICTSYSDDLALDLAVKARTVIESETYQEAFGIKFKRDQNVKGYYANTQGGFRISKGTGGMITGRHAHFLIDDDAIDPEGAHSEKDLKRVNRWRRQTLSNRKVDKKVSVMISVGQRLHQNDPTGDRLSNKEAGPVKQIVLPAEDSPNVKPRSLRSNYRKGLLDPIRMPKSVLREEKGKGTIYYACQFEQSPKAKGGNMFLIDKINKMDTVPRWHEFRKLCRFWDKAGTSKGGAYSVGVLMGLIHVDPGFSDEDLAHDIVWVMDVIRGQWSSWDRESIIKKTAKSDPKGTIFGVEQEPGSGGKESAQATVGRLAGFKTVVDLPTGDKEARADPFSAQVNGGNVYVPANAIWLKEYLDELEYFPNSRYKDQVDASSGAYNTLTKKQKIAGGW